MGHMFLLQVFGVYLDILIYQLALCLVTLVSMYQHCLARVLAGFIHIWMECRSAPVVCQSQRKGNC